MTCRRCGRGGELPVDPNDPSLCMACGITLRHKPVAMMDPSETPMGSANGKPARRGGVDIEEPHRKARPAPPAPRTIRCASCGEPFEDLPRPGPDPERCPDCRAANRRRVPTPPAPSSNVLRAHCHPDLAIPIGSEGDPPLGPDEGVPRIPSDDRGVLRMHSVVGPRGRELRIGRGAA